MRRSGQRLLEGFWEFPSVELRQRGSAVKKLSTFARETLGFNVKAVEPLITVKHSITTRRIELQVFRAQLAVGVSSRINDSNCRWARLKDMSQYPFAAASQRIVEELNRVARSNNQSSFD
jgi:adenine-specific DNA glycosylase